MNQVCRAAGLLSVTVWFHEIRLILCSFPWFCVRKLRICFYFAAVDIELEISSEMETKYFAGSNAFDPEEKNLLGDDLRPSKDASLEHFWDRKFSKIFDLKIFHFHTFSNENFDFF